MAFRFDAIFLTVGEGASIDRNGEVKKSLVWRAS